MKKQKYILTALVVLIGGSFSISCKKNEVATSSQNTLSATLTSHPWSLNSCFQQSVLAISATYTFKADGTGVLTSGTNTNNFKWEINESTKMLKYYFVPNTKADTTIFYFSTYKDDIANIDSVNMIENGISQGVLTNAIVKCNMAIVK